MHLDRKEILQMLKQTKPMATKYGSTRVGLVGLTSEGSTCSGGDSAWITSGNTLTSILVVQSIQAITQRVGMNLNKARVAVVGATGAIGRLVSLMISDEAGALTLVGNALNTDATERCQSIADEIYSYLLVDRPIDSTVREPKGKLAYTVIHKVEEAMNDSGNDSVAAAVRRVYNDLPIRCMTNLDSALGDVDIVVAATNSDTALIQAHHLRDWTIVCDVARPPNVSEEANCRSNALIFDGGLVELPDPVAFGEMGFPSGVCWGSLGETILLALDSAEGDHSIGQALPPLEEAVYITELAVKHGFKAAQPHRFERLIPIDELNDFAKGYAQWQGTRK
jgi:predicted amino acid dehydrogenase